ncbi:hypothetical protein [Streptomyces sp. NPDC055287]
MASEEFNGRNVDVIDFEDVSSGERVIEFHDPLVRPDETLLAISIPEGGTWGDAVVSISPRVGDVSVDFMVWAIQIAQVRVG